MVKPEVIDHFFSCIEQQGRGLTKWEEGFVEDLREQWEEKGRLSERQAEILERIYAEKTPL